MNLKSSGLRTKFYMINSATLRGSDIKCNKIEKFTYYFCSSDTKTSSVNSISVRNNWINSWNAFCLYEKSSIITCLCQLSLFHTCYQSSIPPKSHFSQMKWETKWQNIQTFGGIKWSLFCVYRISYLAREEFIIHHNSYQS